MPEIKYLELNMSNKIKFLGVNVSSSSNSGSLSASVGGLSIVGLAPFIAKILSLFGVDISESELAETIEAVMIAIGSIITAYGLLRKLYNKFKRTEPISG